MEIGTNTNGQNVQGNSMYRLMQHVLNNTTHKLRPSTLVPSKYTLLDNSQTKMNNVQEKSLFDSYNATTVFESNNCQTLPLIRLEQCKHQWHESVSPKFLENFMLKHGEIEVKRQIAIHELYSCEMNLCYEIQLMRHVSEHPLQSFDFLSSAELCKLFPKLGLDKIFEIHHSLACQLTNIRNIDGVYGINPGDVILKWIDSLLAYENYCVQFVNLSDVIKQVRKRKRFSKFMSSEFVHYSNHKMDFDSFLSMPRSQLMRYPLLLSAIRDRTVDQLDVLHLTQAIEAIEHTISNINQAVIQNDFNLVVTDFLEEETTNSSFNNSKVVLLKSRVRQSSRFSHRKLILVLFDRALILARRSHISKKYYSIASIDTNSELYMDFGKPKNYIATEFGLSCNKSRFRRIKGSVKSNAVCSTSLSRRLKRCKTSSTPNLSSTGIISNTSRLSLIPPFTYNTLHLYSVETKFDIWVKFRDSGELEMWINKLVSNFDIHQSVSVGVKAKQTVFIKMLT